MQCNKRLKMGIYPIEINLCVYPWLHSETFSFCEGTTFGKTNN